MATSIPDQPTFVTPSERAVWQKVRAQLSDDCILLANYRLSDQHKDHAADLIVLMPGSGIVVVEVKGSHVWVEPDGRWMIERGGAKPIDPVGQARGALYAVRRYVETDPRWGSRTRVRWSHHVVLARTALADDFATPQCPRWMVTGQQELADLGGRLWDVTSLHRTDARPPSADDVQLIREILVGRNLPGRDLVAIAEDRAEYADRLTMEQAELLRVTRLLNRVEIRGGAGSGKTVLAIRQASDLASGRISGQRQRVAVVCYSYGLAHHLRRALLIGSRSKRPAFVGTFEDLARSWGIDVAGSRDDSDYWEARLPALMAVRAGDLTDAQRFDAVVVDEAQDFADDWWTPLVRALRDEAAGGVYAYSDERQRVFARFGRPPLALVPLVLDHNLRNTRQIASSFVSLAPSSMVLRGGDGPEVEFVASSVDGAIETADDQVDRLLDEGWESKDVALLTVGARHPVQKERQESLGFAAYWEDFWGGDDVFYGHVLGFKGMERRAVVLCLNEDGTRDRSRERLYVGLSRATDRLVVVGDPAVIERVGGREVLERLTDRR
ncbi:MAG: NERD domain-containing protein [Micropruina sp.]|uniref:nuclease-related domain-containing DEAD/DEAH box helicase n=1 Tax=Micropruina sp. TaxID=2737536 RepID=UPI0039E3FB93